MNIPDSSELGIVPKEFAALWSNLTPHHQGILELFTSKRGSSLYLQFQKDISCCVAFQ